LDKSIHGSGNSKNELALLHLRKMAQKHVRPMLPKDIPAVVEIHIAAFSGYFTSMLGPKFLALFYGEIQRSSSAVTYVFERDGRVLGFSVGTFSHGGFYRRLFLRRWFPFAVYSFAAVLKQPTILVRVVRSLFQRVAKPSQKDLAVLGPTAVFPDEEGRGYGLMMVSAFLDHVKEVGGKQVRAEVRKEDQNLIRAYQNMGFAVLRETNVPSGTVLVELCYRIGNGDGHD